MTSASGDIRHIIRTINELPSDYSGKLDIVLNDREPVIVVRNILLLQLCGAVTDSARAADLALHYWYSSFVPLEYDMLVHVLMLKFAKEVRLEDLSFCSSLGSQSEMRGVIGPTVLTSLSEMLGSEYTIYTANDEINRVRCA